MQAIQQWGFALCLSCICGGVFKMVAPSRSMESVFKVAVNVFFLACIVAPLSGLGGVSIALPSAGELPQVGQAQEQVAKQVAALAAENLRVQIGAYLDAQGKGEDYEKIEVRTHVDEEGRIDIREIKIQTGKGRDEALERQVSEAFGLPTSSAEDTEDAG
ncbi:hypothetical protein [Bittarella massiliensis (ex Durand et al. 2017)]|uniref:hypothetical protein n=1 Tax=Bittarella massiliensis (ex Durand et al. 2017) TaxID=1720313 RepID=UPI001AA163F2|nr:hypothetical protein [Bittarella massiliensis (ex Durand et al. 2017)]MBO1678278.1 hypothetical protein [Bittarella massiliensis (ex Durand et al. 2017)]